MNSNTTKTRGPGEAIREAVGKKKAEESAVSNNDQLLKPDPTPSDQTGQQGKRKIIEFHSQPAVNTDEGHEEAMSDADRYRKKTKSKEKDKNEGKDKSRKIKHPFEILGFNESDQVLLWRQGSLLRKGFEEVRRKGFAQAHYGPKYCDPKDKGDYIGRSILYEAHEKGVISEDEPFRVGIWKLDDGGFFIVSGRQCLELPLNGKAKLHKGPVFQERIVIHERKRWVDLGEVEKIYNDLREKGDRHTKREIVKDFERLQENFGQWSWGNGPKDREMMRDYMVTWMFLAPFQHAMRWRPAFYLIGGSSSGKSTFFEQIVSLYSELVCSMAHTTAFAISQKVGNTSKILLLDEFEMMGAKMGAKSAKRDEEIQQTLERIKIMGGGGIHSSGTTEKNPREFALHHWPILASINLPGAIRNDQALRNRFVIFEISKEKGRGGLVGLPTKEVKNLVPRMISCMALLWPEIEQQAKEMRDNSSKIIAEYAKMEKPLVVEQRTVDNFSYATALYKHIFRSGDGCLRDIPKWAVSEPTETDEDILLETILTSTVRHFDGERNRDVNIEELIRTEQYPTSKKTLLRCGLKIVKTRPEGTRYLAIHPKTLQAQVLAKTEFRGRDITSTLRRVQGAKYENDLKVRMGATNRRAIQIPIEALKLVPPNQDEDTDFGEISEGRGYTS